MQIIKPQSNELNGQYTLKIFMGFKYGSKGSGSTFIWRQGEDVVKRIQNCMFIHFLLLAKYARHKISINISILFSVVTGFN